MKKTLLVAAAVSLVTALTGCASNSDPAPSPSASPLDAVSWVEGDPPSLEFKTPFQLKSSSAFKVVKEGDGAEVKPGWLVQVHYVEVNGATGGVLDSTYQQGGPQTYLMAETAPEGDPIWPALKDQKVGARLIVAFATAAAEEPNQSPSAPTMTALLALTITDIQPLPEEESPKPAPDTEGRTRAKGEAVVPNNPDLPAVTLDPEGKPSIQVPKGVNPPAKLVSQVLIKGDGPEVAAADSITAHYTGWLWDGTQFDSSWEGSQGPATFSLQQVVKGWTQGLSGQSVGSQVLLVIPPELGYGDQAQGSIPPGSTLVFVVDILGKSV